MSLRVTEHYPGINAINIPRNAVIEVKFNKGILTGSLDYTHFTVNDFGTFTTVPGTLSVEYNDAGVSDTAVFTPTANLVANNKYRVFLYGRPNSVVSTDNEQLDTTYMFEFTTGDHTIEGTGSGVSESGVAPSGTVLPTGNFPVEDATAFAVYSTDPQNQGPNNPTTLAGIYVTFTGNVANTLAELSGLISIQEDPVLK